MLAVKTDATLAAARDAKDAINDGMAYVRGRYEITLRPQGAPVPLSDQGDFLEVWRKEPDGVWRIIEAIWNTRLPRPA